MFPNRTISRYSNAYTKTDIAKFERYEIERRKMMENSGQPDFNLIIDSKS